MTTGERIQFARRGSGLTQAQLANKLGVKPYVIGNYENDRVDLKRETIEELARILNVRPSWLMGYDRPIGSKE